MTQEALLAAEKIRNLHPSFKPKLAIVLGSGLGELADCLEEAVCISYDELPGFHKPVVEGHVGQLVLGTLEGVSVVFLQGRAHFYEGISASVVKNMVRTCHLLGCEAWLATNASGSLRENVQPGSLVVIKDHINFQFINPLIGPNDDAFGPRFIGMEDAYDKKLQKLLFTVATEQAVPLTDGVYLAVLGPSFETPAEIHAFRMMGADLVGMSTVAEVIAAHHCGMRVAAVSVVTNLAAGMHPTGLSHDETLAGAQLGVQKMIKLIRGVVRAY